MYLKLANGGPQKYTLEKLRADNPSTSFPKLITEEILAGYEVYLYTRSAAPEYDSLTHKVIDGSLEMVEGTWVAPYIAVPLPQDLAEKNLRGRRNRLLSETDWMALSDSTMAAEWASYRQALRDITSQEKFPYAVEWPIKPE